MGTFGAHNLTMRRTPPVSFRSSTNSHIVKNGSLRERERERESISASTLKYEYVFVVFFVQQASMSDAASSALAL